MGVAPPSIRSCLQVFLMDGPEITTTLIKKEEKTILFSSQKINFILKDVTGSRKKCICVCGQATKMEGGGYWGRLLQAKQTSWPARNPFLHHICFSLLFPLFILYKMLKMEPEKELILVNHYLLNQRRPTFHPFLFI